VNKLSGQIKITHQIKVRHIYQSGFVLLSFTLAPLCFGLNASAKSTQTNNSNNKPTGKIYSCTDSNGKKHTSDTPIAACKQRDVHLLDRYGRVIKTIPRPLTPEEINARNAQQEQAKIEAEKLKQKQQADKVLRLRYASEEVLIEERDRTLATLYNDVLKSQQQVSTLIKQQEQLINDDKPTQNSQEKMILSRQLEAEQNLLSKRQSIYEKSAQRYEKDLNDYRAMTKKSK
jgi:Domain of unknown function (DUF4124)